MPQADPQNLNNLVDQTRPATSRNFEARGRLEVRGDVIRIDADPKAELFVELAARYGLKLDALPGDAADRVIFVVEPTAVSSQ